MTDAYGGIDARGRRLLATSLVVVTGAIFALSRPTLRAWGAHELFGAIFLVAAVSFVRLAGDDTRRHGIALGGVFPGRDGDGRSLVRAIVEGVAPALREAAWALSICAIVLPVYALLWPAFNAVPAVRHAPFDARHAYEALVEVIAIALPEEAFYRGWVQTALRDAFGIAAPEPVDAPTPLRDLPARVAVSAGPIVLTSIAFAVGHLAVDITLPRALVFFPALLFGVVREWRGGIGAAVWLHACFNLFSAYIEGR